MKILNDILGYNLKIYQDSSYFKFSLDSIALANIVTIKMKTNKILDLGTGNGIIPIVLSRRTSKKIDAVEIQEDLANLAIESIKYNNLDNQINVYNTDMIDFASNKTEIYDLILSNPPYFKNNEESVKNFDIHKLIARHEVKINLEQIVNISKKLLKNNGTLAMVCRIDRFVEVIETYKKYNIEPKKITFIYDNYLIEPDIFIIEGIKNGKPGLKIAKPFILYDKDGNETEEYKRILGGINNAEKL